MQVYEYQYTQMSIFNNGEIEKLCGTDIIKRQIDIKAFYKLVYVDIRSEMHIYYYEHIDDMYNEIQNLKLEFNHGVYITFYRLTLDSAWCYFETDLFEGEKPDEDE